MEFDRLVQLRTDGGRSFGTGYLVAPRLVLTAAHVVNGPVVQVGLPGGAFFAGVVRWSRKDDSVDAALMEVEDGQDWPVPESLRDLLSRPPQRYGLLVGSEPQAVRAVGFPRFQKEERRLDEQFDGHIAPGTGALAGRYELTSTTPVPDSDANSPWGGMSGAAVLADDLLCGVVRRDRRADGGTRLTATPAAALLSDPGFRVLLAEHTGWEPVLEPIEPAMLLAPAGVGRHLSTPALLLRADSEAVAFHGRERELADLRGWCENGPSTLSVRVLTGPGGQGKTRLARRLADLLGWEGWVTGHLDGELTDTGGPTDLTPLSTSLPLLLVVDYAENRPRVLRRLVAHLRRSRHRVRLLLLARADGEWRTGVFDTSHAVRASLDEAQVTALGPLLPPAADAQDRRAAFERAVTDLARLLPLVPSLPAHDWPALGASLQPPADLDEARYGNALTLQMTALVTLLQRGPQPADAAPGSPPEHVLLRHEERFWESSAKTPAYELRLGIHVLRAAVAVAALCGAATREEAVGVLRTLPGLPAHQLETAAAWLASLYPADRDHYWGSLQPDRVAEFHASRTIAMGGFALPTLLGAATHDQQAQIITVLVRAALAHEGASRRVECEKLLCTLNTALDITPLGYRALRNLSTRSLARGATADFVLRLAADRVHVCRDLADREPDVYEPDLALALVSQSLLLVKAGTSENAVKETQHAAVILSRLVVDDPVTNGPRLALTLEILSLHLAMLGRPDEAVVEQRRAVEIYECFTGNGLEIHEPALARALYELGTNLHEIGDRIEALSAVEQAVAIYERLAAHDPVAYGARLEAVTKLRHAIEIGRPLGSFAPKPRHSESR